MKYKLEKKIFRKNLEIHNDKVKQLLKDHLGAIDSVTEDKSDTVESL